MENATHRVKIWLILLFLIGFVFVINAQVLIENEPKKKDLHSFSALQLSSTTAALRLPQLTTKMRDNLESLITPSNPLSEGLVIYNLDTNVVEYWDGKKWVTFTKTTGTLSSTSDLDITNGNNALLKDFDMQIKDGVITLDHLRGATKPEENDMVYATNDLDGSPEFISKSSLGSPNAKNGVTKTSKNIFELGGTLDKNTDIDLGGYNLNMPSTTGKFDVDNSTLIVDGATKNVGISTIPQTKLQLKGAIATGEVAVSIAGLATVDISTSIPSGQVRIEGIPSSHQFTLQHDGKSVAGQRLVIQNNTDFLGRLDGSPILPKHSGIFTFSNGVWKSLVPSTTVTNMYVGIAKTPGHAASDSPDWGDAVVHDPKNDTPDWIAYSKISRRYDGNGALGGSPVLRSHLDVTYQYTGPPFMDVDKIYPFISPALDSESGVVFSVSYAKLENRADNKTYLTVGISRVDRFDGGVADWPYEPGSVLYILLVRTVE